MTDSFRANLRHGDLIALYDYWADQRDGQPVPPKQRFVGAAMARWAPQMVIIRAQETRNFSYAFYGTSFKKAFGVDMTGASVDQLPRDEASILSAEYRLVVMQRRPFWRIYTAWFGDLLQTWERLALPLADERGAISLILAAAYQIPDMPLPLTRAIRQESVPPDEADDEAEA